MAKPPKKPPVKSETTETKLPPMTQKSMDTASKMDAEDTKSMKKAKGGKVCAKAKGGKVKFDFSKMIADKKKGKKK